MKLRTVTTALLLVSLALLHGCGSSGGGTTVAEGGVSGTGISAGVVTGFGSIFLGEDRHVTTSSTLFLREDSASSEAEFNEGDVVRIDWSLDADGDRVANRVSYFSELKGPVTVAADSTSLAVMGQPVSFDASTTGVGGLDPSTLARCEYVEVSGFRTASGGAVRATLIERESAAPVGQRFRLNGVVEAVTPNFVVSGQIINPGSLALPPIGDVVRVEGVVDSCVPLSGLTALTADRIEPLSSDLGGEDGTDAEVEGLITALPSTTLIADFDVSGVPVAIDASTVFEHGIQANLAVNLRVEVEGHLNAAGVLVADKVKFEDQVKLEADIESISGPTIVLSFGGDVLNVTTNALTEFDVPLASLAADNHVRIEGYTDNGSIIAIDVEREDENPRTKRRLEAAVSAFVATPGSDFVRILDIVVDTSSFSDGDFLLEDTPIGRTEFYNILESTPGTVVQANGDELTGVMDWKEVEIED